MGGGGGGGRNLGLINTLIPFSALEAASILAMADHRHFNHALSPSGTPPDLLETKKTYVNTLYQRNKHGDASNKDSFSFLLSLQLHN